MTIHHFVVMHGDTQITVDVDTDDDVAEAAIMAAASAAETMKSKPFIVHPEAGGRVFRFSHSDIDEWWA